MSINVHVLPQTVYAARILLRESFTDECPNKRQRLTVLMHELTCLLMSDNDESAREAAIRLGQIEADTDHISHCSHMTFRSVIECGKHYDQTIRLLNKRTIITRQRLMFLREEDILEYEDHPYKQTCSAIEFYKPK